VLDSVEANAALHPADHALVDRYVAVARGLRELIQRPVLVQLRASANDELILDVVHILEEAVGRMNL